MVLRAAEFRVSTIRCVFFTPQIAFETSRALSALLNSKRISFDGQVTSLPIPSDAPPQLPRLHMATKDRSYAVEASPEKLVFAWNLTSPAATLAPPEHFEETAIALWTDYKTSVTGRAGRLAVHVNRFVVAEDPAMALAHHFCKPEWLLRTDEYKGPLSRTENFELHAHKRYALNPDCTINSWMRCKTGLLNLGEEKSRIVLTEQDLNTLPEELSTNDFDTDDCLRIFEGMLSDANEIMSSYFPGDTNALT